LFAFPSLFLSLTEKPFAIFRKVDCAFVYLQHGSERRKSRQEHLSVGRKEGKKDEMEKFLNSGEKTV
jgi:hypothetical protein